MQGDNNHNKRTSIRRDLLGGAAKLERRSDSESDSSTSDANIASNIVNDEPNAINLEEMEGNHFVPEFGHTTEVKKSTSKAKCVSMELSVSARELLVTRARLSFIYAAIWGFGGKVKLLKNMSTCDKLIIKGL